MTSFDETHPPRTTVEGERPRPRSLRIGFTTAMLAGLLWLTGALLLMIDAKDLAAQTASDLVGADSGVLGTELLQGAVAEATSTLEVRAVVGVVAAALVMLFAFAARSGSLAGRVVLGMAVLGSVGASLLVVSDVAGPVTIVLDVAAMLLGVIALPAMFVPATGRYARARKGR